MVDSSKPTQKQLQKLIPEVRKKRKPKHSDDHGVMQTREKVQPDTSEIPAEIRRG